MRGRVTFILMTFILMSCSQDEFNPMSGLDYQYGRDLTHDMIVLGDRLENPYTKENMQRAIKSLYPTKADRVDLKTTDLYVRFLPADDAEYDLLQSEYYRILHRHYHAATRQPQQTAYVRSGRRRYSDREFDLLQYHH